MAKQRKTRLERLDSGLLVPYWYSPKMPLPQRAANVQFNAAGQVLFTPDGKVSFGCGGGGTWDNDHPCSLCNTDTNTPMYMIASIPGGWQDFNCGCSSYQNQQYVLTHDGVSTCRWAYLSQIDDCVVAVDATVIATKRWQLHFVIQHLPTGYGSYCSAYWYGSELGSQSCFPAGQIQLTKGSGGCYDSAPNRPCSGGVNMGTTAYLEVG